MIKNSIHRTIISFCLITTALASCVNEESEVEKVTQEDNLPVESTYESEIFFTEHAKLKVKAFAPEMHRYNGDEIYNEMPKGVLVIFYDSVQIESSRLTANYAIDKVSLNIMEAKNDVVIFNRRNRSPHDHAPHDFGVERCLA